MSQADFIALLKKQASIANDEANSMGATLIQRWSDAALRAHNAAYTWNSLPDVEVDCVLLLAWRKVCLWRANKFAQEITQRSGSDYQQDAGTPYKKNMDLYKQLGDDYRQLVADLKLIPLGESILQGRIVHEDSLSDSIEPAGGLLPPAAVVLQAGAVTSTTAILRWTADYFTNFSAFAIISSQTPNIYEDWNQLGIQGIPKIRSDAEFVSDVYDFTQQAVKVTGLDPSTVYYFIVVVRARSGECSYSNEISVTTSS